MTSAVFVFFRQKKVHGIPSSFMFPYENHPILFDPKRGNLFNETIQKNDQIVYCAERAVSGWACTLGGQRQIFPKKDLVPFALADLIDWFNEGHFCNANDKNQLTKKLHNN